jgi:hypothetical protein
MKYDAASPTAATAISTSIPSPRRSQMVEEAMRMGRARPLTNTSPSRLPFLCTGTRKRLALKTPLAGYRIQPTPRHLPRAGERRLTALGGEQGERSPDGDNAEAKRGAGLPAPSSGSASRVRSPTSWTA